MILFDTKQLRDAGHDTALPFRLKLEGGGQELNCEKLLRIVPGIRSVFVSKWGTDRVVAKLFYRPFKIHRHFAREIAGVRALSGAGISVPELLYAGKTEDRRTGVLLFDYIHPAPHFQEALRSAETRDEKLNLLRRLMGMLVTLHQAGLSQKDLHLNNFLVKDREIFFLDGSSIKRRSGGPLNIRRSLDGLSILFSQPMLENFPLMDELCFEYFMARGWKEKDEIFKKLQFQISRSQRHNRRRLVKKTSRESTDLVCSKSFYHFMLCKRDYYTEAMVDFLEDLEEVLNGIEDPLLKRCNSSMVGRVRVGEQELVVKRYNIKGVFHGLRRAFMLTRAMHSWRNSHQLLKMGVSTSRPVALFERRFGPFRGESYFISEYLDGPNVLFF